MHIYSGWSHATQLGNVVCHNCRVCLFLTLRGHKWIFCTTHTINMLKKLKYLCCCFEEEGKPIVLPISIACCHSSITDQTDGIDQGTEAAVGKDLLFSESSSQFFECANIESKFNETTTTFQLRFKFLRRSNVVINKRCSGSTMMYVYVLNL